MKASFTLFIGIAFLIVLSFAQDTNQTRKSAGVKNYKYRSYSEIVNLLGELQKKYPNYVEVYTAEDKYGLPTSDQLMCDVNGKSEYCKHYILQITDKSTLPDKDRPELFFSGALHGNERVGPQTVVELALLLLDHVSRPDGLPWLQRLVKTRTLIIMPTTNPHGYDSNVRGELNIDPNRDFVYQSAPNCMRSLTARAVNEVWRDHLFQLSITFHSGTQVIAYEWGSENHYKGRDVRSQRSDTSPDDLAQEIVTLSMSKYGGAFDDHALYPTGIDNDIVYPVSGGMEDWAYAGSWEDQFTAHNNNRKKINEPCRPSSFGGYPAEKTTYNEATLRALNILVETSYDKTPVEADLGDDKLLSDANIMKFFDVSTIVGHVPRNIRLCLILIDTVQPYIEWRTSEKLTALTTDRTMSWEVLGSYTVDQTYLQFSTSPDFAQATSTAVQSGKTRWYQEGSNVLNGNGVFNATINFPSSGTYYVRAVAQVDQEWGKQKTGADAPSPTVPPQSHVVNARTNPNWNKESSGHRVKGQVDWYSETKKIVV